MEIISKSGLIISEEINNDLYLYSLVGQIIDNLDIEPATCKEYKTKIKPFIEFVKSSTFDNDVFLRYKKYLKEKDKISAGTKSKYLSVASKFLKELYRLGHVKKDLTIGVKGFKSNGLHKRDGFNEKEISKITEAINKLSEDSMNIRFKAIYSLLVYQGLRQIEIIRLDLEDLNLSENTAKVLGKGREEKETIHLNPATVVALQRHIEYNKVVDGAIFKSLGNRKSDRLSTRTIKREVERIIMPLEIEKTTHGFRHYFVTRLLEDLDIRDVRKFSRHKNMQTVIVYDDELDLKKKSEKVFNCFNHIKIK